jgi:hypothetical protein
VVPGACCDVEVAVEVTLEADDDAADEDDAEDDDAEEEEGAEEDAPEEEGAGLDVRLGASSPNPRLPIPIGWLRVSAVFCGVTNVVAPRTASPPALAAPTRRPIRPPSTERLLRRALTVAHRITIG